MKKNITRSIVLMVVAMFFAYSGIHAQPGIGISYRFTSAAGFTAFPAGSTTQIVPAANQDDFGYLFAPAGMNIRCAGITYQKFVVSTNGWLALVPNAVAAIPASLSAGGYLNTNQLSNNTTGYPIIAPYWDDLQSSTFSYIYTAGALWVRWTAKIDKTNTTAANLFWVKIDGTNGVITYYYTSAAYTITGVPSASIGLAGTCVGDYYSYNLPTAPAYADSTIETTTCSGRPSNVTYTFTPYQLYDDCATAKDIGPMTSTCTPVTFNLNNAITSGSAMSCSPGGTDVDDMWFMVVKPTGVTNVVITTSSAAPACQSVTGTSVEVFSGPCPGTSLGCATTSVANPGFGEVTLTRPCSPETLYVRVTADGDVGGKFKICTKDASPVTGYTCANATPICAPLPYNRTGMNTQGFGNDYGGNLICQSQWMTGEDYVFAFTPSSTQCFDISIDGTGANSYPGLHVLVGCPDDTLHSTCIANATNISNGDTIHNLTLAAGVTYYILVDNNATLAAGAVSHIPFNFHITNSVGSIPPYDGCALAMPLGNVALNANCTWSTNFTTECATPSPAGIGGAPDPLCGGFIAGAINDVWFTFTPTFAGSILINTQAGTVNPAINVAFAVYSGNCGALTMVGCAGDSVAIPFMASLSLTVSPQTYYIRLWTHNGYDPGTFQICFTSNCAPPNDFPVNAITLPLAVPTLGDNTCSTGTNEMPNPVNCTSAPINTVWYKVTAGPTGQLAVRISQVSMTDAALAAFTFPTGPANAASSYTNLACNDDIIFAPPCPICGMTGDNDAAIQFTVLPFATVYIAVDGEGSSVGTFWITAIEGTLASTFPPVYRKDCLNPEFLCNNGNYLCPNGGIGSDGNICDFQNLACTGGATTTEVGSTWLSFTVSPGSTLGFTITPNDSATPVANYNFYLWDITGISNPCSALVSNAPVRCNTVAGTGKTGCKNLTAGNYANTVSPFLTAHNYLLYIENLTAASDDESVPGTNVGFVLNWDIWTGGVNTGTQTQIVGSSPSCLWIPTVIDTDYNKQANWHGVGNCPAPTPSCTTDVFISAANKQCWVTGNSYARTVTINVGGTLKLMPGSVLHVCGDFINNGNFIASAGSTVIFEGPVNQSISGFLTGANAFASLTVDKQSGTGNVTLLANADLTQNFLTNTIWSIFNINGKYMKVGGNFTNSSGATTFTGIGGSTVEFNGLVNQNFLNSISPITLNRVIMNKPSAKLYLITSALSTMNIDSALTLTSGIIVTPKTAGAQEVNVKYYLPACVTGQNALSYVDGRIRRKIANPTGPASPIIPASYDFPVGDSLTPGGYENANIEFKTSTLVNNVAAFFNPWPGVIPTPPTPGPTAPMECIYAVYDVLPMLDNGYWTFERPVTPSNGGYRVTLYNTGYTNQAGANGWSLATATNINSLPGLTASWSMWATCMLTSTLAATKRDNLNVNPYPGSFNQLYATAQSQSVLPIELLYFNAESLGDQVLCKWETASEINNDYFEVERSTNGIDFVKIGSRIKGFGNGTSTHSIKYSLIDDEQCKNIVYYRLRQVDINGADSYSDVVAVNCGNLKTGLSIHPNPAKSDITLSFIEPSDGDVIINFIDYTGRVVLSHNSTVKKGYNELLISIDDLSKGVYYIDVQSDKMKSNIMNPVRFVKN